MTMSILKVREGSLVVEILRFSLWLYGLCQITHGFSKTFHRRGLPGLFWIAYEVSWGRHVASQLLAGPQRIHVGTHHPLILGRKYRLGCLSSPETVLRQMKLRPINRHMCQIRVQIRIFLEVLRPFDELMVQSGRLQLFRHFPYPLSILISDHWLRRCDDGVSRLVLFGKHILVVISLQTLVLCGHRFE